MFSCLLFFNAEMWLLYLVLNVVDASPMYSDFWSPDLTIGLYTRESVKYLWSVECSEFFYCDYTIILALLGMQL